MTPSPPTIAEWNKATVKVAVDWVAQELAARVEADLKANGDEWLEGKTPDALLNGSMPIDWELNVIEAAEAGDHVAHNSLVKAYWETRRSKKETSPFVESYVGRAQLRPEPRRKPGGFTPHQHVLRDRILMDLVVIVCEVFDIQPTRNRNMRRAAHPCGASIVAAAAGQLGINVGEDRLKNLFTENDNERGKAAVSEVRNYARKKLGLPAI